MEIIVEIGTPEQQANIRKELELFSKTLSKLEKPISLNIIVVPINFDATVNNLQGTIHYESCRGVIALAKNVNLRNGVAIVFSPSLYMDPDIDTRVRLYIFFHELKHVVNKVIFPIRQIDSESKKIYFDFIYTLYDEYTADRFALELVKDHLPQNLKTMHFIKESASGFLNHIIDIEKYNYIKSEIDQFRTHADVILFEKNIHEVYSNMSICLTHAFSISDHDPNILSLKDLKQSCFVNDKTLKLMHYFNKKYSENINNLDDGIDLVIDFLTNFGMKFEDRPKGLYCHVLDI